MRLMRQLHPILMVSSPFTKTFSTFMHCLQTLKKAIKIKRKAKKVKERKEMPKMTEVEELLSPNALKSLRVLLTCVLIN